MLEQHRCVTDLELAQRDGFVAERGNAQAPAGIVSCTLTFERRTDRHPGAWRRRLATSGNPDRRRTHHARTLHARPPAATKTTSTPSPDQKHWRCHQW